ncbi:MAG: DUF3592 domain-containing protein [Pyrinomonadaceae bacterium]
MGIVDKLLRRKKPDPDARRRMLLATGRITDGVIIDSQIEPSGDELVYYTYTLNGVDFESSDYLTPDQRRNPISYAPGARVGIRYDPRNQGNSVVE